MALGALISAYHDVAGAGGTSVGGAIVGKSGAGGAGGGGTHELRATLPLAGRTLVEYQARLAHAAGADPIVVLVERMTAALLAAVDRLGADGNVVHLARGVDEAAGYFAPGDRVLVLAGGLFADAASVERVADSPVPTILTLADNIGLEGFERIDAGHRWAGLALASGAQIADTAAMLGDWDLQSTLLRRLVQDGARHMPAVIDTDALAGAPMLLMATGARDLDDAERRLFAGARSTRDDWVERHVTPMLEEFAVERLMRTRVQPVWLVMAAVSLTGFAALCFAREWFGAALVALLLSIPLDGVADRLAALRMKPLSRAGRLRRSLPFVAGAALAALGFRLAATGGWGCIATAVTALIFFHAAAVERRDAKAAPSRWLASRKGSILLGVPFALAGSWLTALVAVALYAGGSFLWLQRAVHRPGND